MENAQKTDKKWQKLLKKWKEILIIGGLALLVIFLVWKTFYSSEETTNTVGIQSENEAKLCSILSQIEGVGRSEVMIYENEGVKSVVVVCEGANSLQVILDVREAVCAALGTDAKDVKIYQLKE